MTFLFISFKKHPYPTIICIGIFFLQSLIKNIIVCVRGSVCLLAPKTKFTFCLSLSLRFFYRNTQVGILRTIFYTQILMKKVDLQFHFFSQIHNIKFCDIKLLTQMNQWVCTTGNLPQGFSTHFVEEKKLTFSF